jgi:hypothetical protein
MPNSSNSMKLNSNSGAKSGGESGSNIMGILIIIGIALVILGGAVFLVYKYVYNPSNRKIPTTANMQTILQEQKDKLKSHYEMIDKKKALVALPANQNFFVNYHMRFENYAGYMGPHENGIFEPASAIPLSIANGVRGFILNVEDIDGKPMVFVRNSEGVKLSMNEMTAAEVIDRIVENAFKETIEGRSNNMRSDPCVIYLRFNLKKGQALSLSCADSLANTFTRYGNMLLTTNEKGDFTSHKNEGGMLMLPLSALERKIIVLSNIDTRAFTSSGGKRGLDYFINGIVWRYSETSVDPILSSERFIYEVPYSFTRFMNEERATLMKREALKKFFIVSNPYEIATLPDKPISVGLQGLSGFSFEYVKAAGEFKPLKDVFKNGGFPKKEDVRYIEKEPMMVSKAPTELNSNGGVIVAPKVG